MVNLTFINYTDLNKACHKDIYPLPCINRLVDEACGFRLISFLDAYSGYNQIKIILPDQEKMTFIIDGANFRYKVMLIDLKNAGATYQRFLDKVFKELIRKNVEVYVNNIIVK